MWIEISKTPPPKGEVIKTKIDDGNISRNEQNLFFESNLWWLPDGSAYVYYTPTHWWG